MTQKGSKEEFDSDKYQKNWEEKWKYIKDPRPWRERIYGAGNYSFQITVQGIDSYNIKIEVPKLEAKSEKKSDNLYSNETDNIIKKLHLFIDEYNNILSAKYDNLSSFFLKEEFNAEDFSSIISEYMQKRAGGLIIEDIVFNDIHIIGKFDSDGQLKQANSAVVKGSLIIERNGLIKAIPLDLDLFKERSEWKLNNPIIIRD